MKPEELIGKYLRDRKPSSEEERFALDHVWKDLRAEGDCVPEDVLRDFQAVRPMPRRLLWAAAAAIVLFVVLSSAILVRNFRQSTSPAVVETVDGGLQRISGERLQAVHAGEPLAFGEVIRSSGGAGEVLALVDGSRVEMRSQSELSLERVEDGVRIRLNKGSVIVTAAKQGAGHLYVQTKDVTVSVVGTVFLVNAEEAGSRVAVIQGEVSVQQGATLKKLLSGEQVATNPIMQSVPVIEEIQWSRNVLAHLALLFSKSFAGILGRPVIDKTGIPGLFDFHLEFAPDESTPSLLLSPPGAPPSPVAASDPGGPSIFTAFQEQLGLKLEPTKGPGEFIVIDNVERPTEN